MKTVIIYASKYGMTKKLANIVVRHRTNVHLYSIKEWTKDIGDYDEIVLGTPIYAGKINKKIKKMITKNEEILLNKTVRIFICGMMPDNEDEVIAFNFSKGIQEHAKIKYIGGAYQFTKMNWLFKMIVRQIAKTNEDQEVIIEQNITELLQ